MYLVLFAWLFVTVLMALAEATSPQGSIVGAVVTLVGYGLLPCALLAYLLGTPGRKRRLREADERAEAATHGAVPPERKET
ncbi:hypothetical protein [Inhella gelatinilytica]|uniref:Transmembrane protein n=1 Tax=Inhella gelatinilytica TaxID=2795030 RepID=A0A931NCX7_9BURK|nr:hypothetical protein [Inhella gelatinilytica]MBH9552497.1 hypothetical protein [Inhella gelatinilytica]